MFFHTQLKLNILKMYKIKQFPANEINLIQLYKKYTL